MGRGAENVEKKNKTGRRKTLANDNKVKRRIQGKSNNNIEHFWFYTLCKKIYFAQKYISKR